MAARQMTMEVGESEHIHGRITALRQQLAKRKAELEKRKETVRALAQLYTQCEQMLDELARHCKTPRHSPRGLKQSEVEFSTKKQLHKFTTGHWRQHERDKKWLPGFG